MSVRRQILKYCLIRHNKVLMVLVMLLLLVVLIVVSEELFNTGLK